MLIIMKNIRKSLNRREISVSWLRKQRDGLINAIKEDIRKMKNRTEKIKEKMDIINKNFEEVVKLNDKINDIVNSFETDSDSDSDSEN